jgi:hypothetical protein
MRLLYKFTDQTIHVLGSACYLAPDPLLFRGVLESMSEFFSERREAMTIFQPATPRFFRIQTQQTLTARYIRAARC